MTNIKRFNVGDLVLVKDITPRNYFNVVENTYDELEPWAVKCIGEVCTIMHLDPYDSLIRVGFSKVMIWDNDYDSEYMADVYESDIELYFSV